MRFAYLLLFDKAMNVLRPILYTLYTEATQSAKRVHRLRLSHDDGDASVRQLGQFVNLEELHLGWCSFNELPQEIQYLPRLQSLTCLNTPLETLPDWLFSNSQLRHLAIRGSDIQIIPDGIGQMYQLRELELGNNGLSTVPAALGSLRQLEYLNLPDNCLTDLPYDLSHLSSLSTLGLVGNRFGKPEADKIKAWFHPGVVIT